MMRFLVRFSAAAEWSRCRAFRSELSFRGLAVLGSLLALSGSPLASPIDLRLQGREGRRQTVPLAYLPPVQGPPSVRGPLLVPIGTPWADCRLMSNLDRSIEACTIVIDGGQVAKKAKATALSNRCGAFQNNGMLDRAIVDCDEAIKLDQSNFDAFYNRGRAKRKKGDSAGAITDYSEAIRLSPRSPKAAAKAYNNRGDAYAALGDSSRAIADFRQAIALDRTYAKAFYNRGAVRARKGDLDRAIKDYSRAIELEPNLGRAFMARGNVYMRKSNWERAVADYKEVLRIDKDDTNARKSLERAAVIVSGRSGSGPAANLDPVQDPVQMD